MIYHLRHSHLCLLIDLEIIDKVQIQVFLHFVFVINAAFALLYNFLDLLGLPIIMHQWHVRWNLHLLGIRTFLDLLLGYIEHIQYRPISYFLHTKLDLLLMVELDLLFNAFEKSLVCSFIALDVV